MDRFLVQIRDFGFKVVEAAFLYLLERKSVMCFLLRAYDTCCRCFIVRGNIKKFHRVFAKFIWRSGSEPMRRDNIFRSVQSGALGLIHLFIR